MMGNKPRVAATRREDARGMTITRHGRAGSTNGWGKDDEVSA